MADYLTVGLTEGDERAAFIIDKYLDTCNRALASEISPSLEHLLVWTHLYNKLQSKSLNGGTVNWFRVLCYVLDQRRLKEALKRIEQRETSKKRTRQDASFTICSDSNKNVNRQNGDGLDVAIEYPDSTLKRPRLADHEPVNSQNSSPKILQTTVREKLEIVNADKSLNHSPPIEESTTQLQLNLLFYWISKAAEVLRTCHVEEQPSEMNNVNLMNTCESLVDLMGWIGVFIDAQSGLNHSTESLQQLLASIGGICSRNQRLSNLPQTPSVTTLCVPPTAAVRPAVEVTLDLKSDQMISVDVPIAQHPTGQWRNPRFAEWLRSHHAASVISCRLQSTLPLPGYHSSGTQHGKGDVVFLLGVLSMMSDLLEEYWRRVRAVITAIRISTSLDFLQDKKNLANLPSLKYCSNANGLNVGELYNAVNKLLRNNKLPRDIYVASLPALERFSTAYEDWREIQKANEQKKRAIDEEERIKREAERKGAQEKDQHRQDVVEFLKEGLRWEEAFDEKNPFWVLGIDPLSATDDLLKRVKKKLLLLLHPDKCPDPSCRSDANDIFLGFTSSMDEAQRLLREGQHCYMKAKFPARAVAPYAASLGIPIASSSATSQTQAPAPCRSESEVDHHKGATPNDDHSAAAIPVISWFRPSEFARFVLDNNKILRNARKCPNRPLESPTILRFSCQRSNRIDILITAPRHHHILGFISRPTMNIQWPKEFLNTSSTQSISEQLKMCSAIFRSQTNPLGRVDIQDIEAFPPVHESIVDNSDVYLAVQTVEPLKEDVSVISWSKLKARRFCMPPTKCRIIGMIQQFCNAPDAYNVKSILESTLHFEFGEDSAFPSASVLNGYYISDLKETLKLLVAEAANAEQKRTR